MKTSVQIWQSDLFANTRNLHWYITQNQLEAVKWCLQNRAHLNALSPAPHSNSALHLAAYAGNNDILKFLLSVPDIKINQQDDGGNTVLVFSRNPGITNKHSKIPPFWTGLYNNSRYIASFLNHDFCIRFSYTFSGNNCRFYVTWLALRKRSGLLKNPIFLTQI